MTVPWVSPSLGGGVAVVLGTRPEIVKLAPVVQALGRLARVVLTGQHYDEQLAGSFLRSSRFPAPSLTLHGVGGQPRALQLSRSLTQLVAAFTADPPLAVLVQGDTNSANAGAQAAHYCGIPVVHVEAGLRSYDRAMPEEINRLVIGAVADVHCCATRRNADSLLAAGAPASAVHVTGNTIVEATLAALPGAQERRRHLGRYGVTSGQFVLATIHRPENTDDVARLGVILGQLGMLGLPVLMPLHPRTRARVDDARLAMPATVRVVPPLDHGHFLAAAQESRLLVSDSGGVQEEVTVLKRPLVVVRNSTERLESIEAGFALLVQPEGVLEAAGQLLDPARQARLEHTASPFGDGRAGARIAGLTRDLLAGRRPAAAAAGSAVAADPALPLPRRDQAHTPA